MPPIQSKLGNKTLHSQTREVVNNVHSFRTSEAAAGHVLIPIKKSKRERERERERVVSTAQICAPRSLKIRYHSSHTNIAAHTVLQHIQIKTGPSTTKYIPHKYKVRQANFLF
jgi:hypothetical protein